MEDGGEAKGRETQEGEGGEEISVKTKGSPAAPTKTETEQHLPLHTPCRSLCKLCVPGGGIGVQHRGQGRGEEHGGTTVSLDYAVPHADEKGKGLRSTVATYDSNTQAILAFPVDRKRSQRCGGSIR